MVGRGADRHAVEVEGLDDLGLDGVVHRHPGDAVDHLADEKAVGDAVVAVPGAGLVARCLGREPAAHEIPVEHLVGVGDHVAEVVHARGVVEELADGDALLARGCELRPVGRDRFVVVDQAPVDEPVHRGGDHALGRGEAHRHRVGLPRRARRVACAGPRVDDQLAAVVHGHGGTAAALVRGDTAERLGDAAEVGVDEARNHPFMVARFSDRPGIG